MNIELDDYSQTEAFEETELQESSKIETFEVTLDLDGERLDKVLASSLKDISRSRLKTLIEDGFVKVNGKTVDKPKEKMSFGDEVSVEIKPRLEDMDFIATPMDDTLLNGLLAYNSIFRTLPRAGIVHRLDRDTTGLMVVAKNEKAMLDLVQQLQARTVKREYWALTRGKAPADKVIEAAIERDPRNPLRFTIGKGGRAKPATTHIRCIDQKEVKGKPFSWVACRLKTGRTHQIRVHMESIGLPLIGDPLYRNKLPKPKEDGSVLNSFDRQALHASRLGLIHPVTKQTMEWFAEPPQDFRDLMDELGFGPWDRPSEVFGDPVVMIDNDELSENQKVVGKISSWDDFDFGDDDEDADSNWKIERTK